MSFLTIDDALRDLMPQLAGNREARSADRVRLIVDGRVTIDLAFDARHTTLWMSHSFGPSPVAHDMLSPLDLLRRSNKSEAPFRVAYAMNTPGHDVVLCLPLSSLDMTPERFEAASLWFIDRVNADRMQFGVA